MMGSGPWSVTPGSDSSDIPPGCNLDYAIRYIQKLGWSVFPLVPGQKRPATKNGFYDASRDIDTVKQWWSANPNAGIGVPVKDNNLIVLDIDPRNGGETSFEQLLAKHGQLPDTATALTGGDGYHYVFSTAFEMAKHSPMPGIDILSDGYFIVEPSVHPSGKAYAWEGSSDPLVGQDIAPVPEWVVNKDYPIKTAAPRPGGFGLPPLSNVKPVPTESDVPAGNRNNNLAGLVGIWIAEGATRGECLDKAHQWNSELSQPLPENEVDRTVFSVVKGHNQRHPGSAVPVAKIDDSISLEDVEDWEDNPLKIPPHLLQMPVPMLQKVVNYMESTTDLPVRPLSVVGAIGLISVLAGRKYFCNYRSNGTALYISLGMQTGKGKDVLKKQIANILIAAELRHLIGPGDFTSDSAVRSALMGNPTKIAIVDEYGDKLAYAMANTNSQKYRAFDCMKEVYNCDSTWFEYGMSSLTLRPHERQGLESNEIVYPSLTKIGIGTLDQYMSAFRTRHISGGALNREIFLPIDNWPVTREYGKQFVTEVPQEIIDWCKQIRCDTFFGRETQTSEDYKVKPEITWVGMTTEARSLVENFLRTVDDDYSIRPKPWPDMVTRWVENAVRLATGLAVASGLNPHAGKLEVTAELMQWAIDFVEFWGKHAVSFISENMVETEYEGLRKAFLDAIRDETKRHGGIEKAKMHKKSPFRSVRTRERNDILNDLIMSELIAQEEVGTKGRKLTKFKAIRQR